MPIPNISAQSPVLIKASCMPIWSSCFCIGVSGVSTSPTSVWIMPISVSRPVATTIANPLPPDTMVPM